ncbi:MAG: hypothetical protein COB53_12010, partial [Elusimicrobia bacterium]
FGQILDLSVLEAVAEQTDWAYANGSMIEANGQKGNSAAQGGGGGGSGGAVNINVTGSITGSGLVTVNGGDAQGGAGDDFGGGGGGGRIAISGTSCSATFSTAAVGGLSGDGGTGNPGGPGSIGTVFSPNLISAAGFGGVAQSSTAILWNWTPEPGATGHKVFRDGGSAVSGLLGGAAVDFSEGSLTPNTTYTNIVQDFICFGSSDSINASIATLTKQPLGVEVAQTFLTSVTLRWNVFPAGPPQDSAFGYRIEASTAPDFSGTLLSTETPNITLSTLTVSGLNENTTFYYRVGASNHASLFNYRAAPTTPTLAKAVSGITLVDVFVGSATLSWTPRPTSPLADTAEGYRLEASTASDFSGTIRSSATPLVSLASLNVSNLDANSTYYFRVGSLNHSSVGNFLTGPSTSTLALAPTSLPVTFLGVFQTSVTVAWAALLDSPPAALKDSAFGYTLEASTAADFTGSILFSSNTTDVSVSTLTMPGLQIFTSYYFRVGSLNSQNISNFTILGSTLTTGVDYGVVVSTPLLDILGFNIRTEVLISTSFIVTSVGNVAQTYEISATTITAGSPWDISLSSSGVDQFTLQALFNSLPPLNTDYEAGDKLLDTPTRCDGVKFEMGGQSCVSVGAGEDRLLWFQLGLPFITSTDAVQDIQITITATPP